MIPRGPGLLVLTALAGCSSLSRQGTEDTGTETTAPEPAAPFPIPDDVATIDWVSAFQEAVALMSTVSTIQPWTGHAASLDARAPGCPDFWTGTFTDAGIEVAHDYGVSWWDDCGIDNGQYYDGWAWWDFDVSEDGDPDSYDGRISDASRTLEGSAVVGDEDGVKFEFDGTASDAFYEVKANGYHHVVYSTSLDATITGSDVFAPDGPTPDGYRTDLYMYVTSGDIDSIEASGNVYMFTPQLMGRFDSIGVDMLLQGPLGAAPDDCTQEPLGWIGLRDADAIWYDVVFLPRTREDVAGETYPNDPLSVCDGCGRLYVQGIEQVGVDVCVDFSFLFDDFPVPNTDDYVLPLHAL